ncbi:hypothetical protein Dimus_033858 [Dionaea muscipula]
MAVETALSLSFYCGKVKVLTKCLEYINCSITLQYDGNLYPIRVLEEQVVLVNRIVGEIESSCTSTSGESSEGVNKNITCHMSDQPHDQIQRMALTENVIPNMKVSDALAVPSYSLVADRVMEQTTGNNRVEDSEGETVASSDDVVDEDAVAFGVGMVVGSSIGEEESNGAERNGGTSSNSECEMRLLNPMDTRVEESPVAIGINDLGGKCSDLVATEEAIFVPLNERVELREGNKVYGINDHGLMKHIDGPVLIMKGIQLEVVLGSNSGLDYVGIEKAEVESLTNTKYRDKGCMSEDGEAPRPGSTTQQSKFKEVKQ